MSRKTSIKKFIVAKLRGLFFIVTFLVPLYFLSSYIVKKPDISNIINDSLIFRNDSLILHPACVSKRNILYIKEYDDCKWTILSDGAIPRTSSQITLITNFPKVKTCAGHWYGEDCLVKIIYDDNIFTSIDFQGKAEKNEKKWDNSVTSTTWRITPQFKCDIFIDSAYTNLIINTKMTLHYPSPAKFGFINYNSDLSEKHNLVVLPKEKFIALVNYECWNQRASRLMLVLFLYLMTYIILVSIILNIIDYN